MIRVQIEIQNEPFKVIQKPLTPTDTENEYNIMLINEPQIKKNKSLLADSDEEDSEVDENYVKVQLKKHKKQKDGVSEDGKPLIWCKEDKNKFPAIVALAMKYLSIVATSVPSERLFSQVGLVISQQQTRLLPGRVNDFLFLNSHFKSRGKIINASTLFSHIPVYFLLLFTTSYKCLNSSLVITTIQ